MTTTPQNVKLSLLTLNPALATVPMMGDVAARFMGAAKLELKKAGQDIAHEKDALWASLDREGILEAVKAHRDEKGNLIVDDGRHRLEWAAARGYDEVPVIEVTKEQGQALAEATVIGRRHWTKGQRAYLGVILHPEVCNAAAHRPKNPDSIGVSTAAGLAERLGVSDDTVLQAVELYRLFHAPGAKKGSPEVIEAAAKKEKYEMSIWLGAGLGAVLAGIGGDSTGKPKPASGFHGLDKPLGTLVRFGKLYTGWESEERSKALRLMTTRFKEDMTPEFRLALSEALAAADDQLAA